MKAFKKDDNFISALPSFIVATIKIHHISNGSKVQLIADTSNAVGTLLGSWEVDPERDIWVQKFNEEIE